MIHEECGHTGIEATYIACRKKYNWKCLYLDVKKYVEECFTCKKFSKGDLKLQKYRNELIEPFHILSVDIIGPLPKSYNRNKYIIVCIDNFSRYIETMALKQKDGKTVAKFFVEKILLKYGSPKILNSDWGNEFNNNV